MFQTNLKETVGYSDENKSLYNGVLEYNTAHKMEGSKFLGLIKDNDTSVCFFDPQYRGILDKLQYGNEGINRGQERSQLSQMSLEYIKEFIRLIDKKLKPSGHLFLWVDKFHLCQGVNDWFVATTLDIVDMIVWNKDKMGMGYRTRRFCEYLVILQKKPRKAKGVWNIHNIPDYYTEKIKDRKHTHQKPVKLQSILIEAVTMQNDLVIDPCAGSFSVLQACLDTKRCFLGCDINGATGKFKP